MDTYFSAQLNNDPFDPNCIVCIHLNVINICVYMLYYILHHRTNYCKIIFRDKLWYGMYHYQY